MSERIEKVPGGIHINIFIPNWKLIFAVIVLVIAGLSELASAEEDHSTWRFGSPSTFNQRADYYLQHGGGNRGGGSGGYGGGRGDIGAATIFNTMFRAISPKLYNATQAPQVVIYYYNTSDSEQAQRIIPPPARSEGAVSGWAPEYPKALVP